MAQLAQLDKSATRQSKVMPMTTYLWGCIFYMIGSLGFVIGTGFFFAHAVRLAKAR